jgi:hypothetical protein
VVAVGDVWSRLRCCHRACWSGAETRHWREFQYSDVAPGPCGGTPNISAEVTAAHDRADPCRMLAVGRFRPSQWHERVCTIPWRVATQNAPAALRRLRPVSGRLIFASSLVDPFLFPLRWAHCGPRYPEGGFRRLPGHRPGRGPGLPRRPGSAPGRVRRGCGPRTWRRRGSHGASGCRLPVPGD